MAFTAGKSKEIEGKSNDWLLDQSLMQSMQDRFCDANNVYMVCLNAQNGVVTKAYGTKEELEYETVTLAFAEQIHRICPHYRSI